MPTFGQLLLTDSYPSTPVDHPFDPVTIDGNVARYADREGGIPIGFSTLDISIRPPSPKSLEKMYLVTIKLRLPTLEVTSPSTSTGYQPAPSVAYSNIAEFKFWLSERSTVAERAAIISMMGGLLGASVVTDMVQDLAAIY